MNKQFDLFQKMKLKETCETISKMTYAYVNPTTKEPTVVPSKHYRGILEEPVEALVEDHVKKQFLAIMYKQMKNLKDEEIMLFYQALLLLDIGKSPETLDLNEELALKQVAVNMMENEKRLKKNFHMFDANIIQNFNDLKEDSEFIKEALGYTNDIDSKEETDINLEKLKFKA